MGISHYLAMTAAEIAAAPALPERLAYMACHFSLYGTGLTGCPEDLPKQSMLILNDRVPFCGHDPALMAEQMDLWAQRLDCGCVLLDFQREDTPQALAHSLAQAMAVPVGIPPRFDAQGRHPVFLPPCPPDQLLEDYLRPWEGREVWLETTPETHQILVDAQGASRSIQVAAESGDFPFFDEKLCCHYRTEVFPDKAVFTLQRQEEDMAQLQDRAEALGVSRTVSLYQYAKKLPVK